MCMWLLLIGYYRIILDLEKMVLSQLPMVPLEVQKSLMRFWVALKQRQLFLSWIHICTLQKHPLLAQRPPKISSSHHLISKKEPMCRDCYWWRDQNHDQVGVHNGNSDLWYFTLKLQKLGLRDAMHNRRRDLKHQILYN